MLEYIIHMTDRLQGLDTTLVIQKFLLAMSGASKGKSYRHLVPWALFKLDKAENRQRIRARSAKPQGVHLRFVNFGLPHRRSRARGMRRPHYKTQCEHYSDLRCTSHCRPSLFKWSA